MRYLRPKTQQISYDKACQFWNVLVFMAYDNNASIINHKMIVSIDSTEMYLPHSDRSNLTHYSNSTVQQSMITYHSKVSKIRQRLGVSAVRRRWLIRKFTNEYEMKWIVEMTFPCRILYRKRNSSLLLINVEIKTLPVKMRLRLTTLTAVVGATVRRNFNLTDTYSKFEWPFDRFLLGDNAIPSNVGVPMCGCFQFPCVFSTFSVYMNQSERSCETAGILPMVEERISCETEMKM